MLSYFNTHVKKNLYQHDESSTIFCSHNNSHSIAPQLAKAAKSKLHPMFHRFMCGKSEIYF